MDAGNFRRSIIWITLSSLTCAISMILLIVRIFEVGLISVFFDFISYYQKITIFIFGYFPDLFDIQVPQILADFWAFSFFCTLVWIRELVLFMMAIDNLDATDVPFVVLGFIVMVFTGLGLMILFIVLPWPLTKHLANKLFNEISFLFEYSVVQSFRISMLLILLFFAANAYAPSV